MNRKAQSRPEILAPAGTEEAFAAALASAADAVYLGLSEGFNARGRSTAFSVLELPKLARRAHVAGAKLYLTLNTLIFENELEDLERLLRQIVVSGVDALIVQDPATAFLAKRLAPDIRLHASTQMTISSAEGAQFAETLGIQRVVLPRELSTKEITQFTQSSPLESEVFVHGALCMAWSGQCLTSEAFSDRSANRGQCSQACRMPYDAIVDGERRELGDKRYLLSPQDLAAHDALPELLDAGVLSLKIEGRYKGPAYVGTAVDSWRNWRDAVLRGATDEDRRRLEEDIERTQLTFSRGGSMGFLAGDNHQTLVVATTPKHRGLALGAVQEVRGRCVRVVVAPEASQWLSRLRPGLGVKFEPVGRSTKEHDPENVPGGPLFGVRRLPGNVLELTFGRPGPELSKVRAGDLARLTGDPEIVRGMERRSARVPEGRLELSLRVMGKEGRPLRVEAIALCAGRQLNTTIETQAPLALSRSGSGLDVQLLRDKLGSLGGTPFALQHLDASQLEAGLHIPVSELKRVRRQFVAQLEAQLGSPMAIELPRESAVASVRSVLSEMCSGSGENAEPASLPQLVPLCRTEEQLEAVIQCGLAPGAEIELDWMEMVGLGRAVKRAKDAGLKVTLATVRVQKPGEEAYDRRIAALAPEGVLVRHWGALMHFSSKVRSEQPLTNHQTVDVAAGKLMLHGDFSLNVTNSLTAHHLLRLGLHTVTASHDLNREQLLELLKNVPRGRVAVTLHHHIPTFHNSHCVYAHLLSQGTDFRSCGRPCEKHRIALRDYAGHEHPVVVDVSCRNTMFNAFAQSAAPLVPQLLELGVQRFRAEFVWERAEDVKRTLTAYQDLLAGRLSPTAALEAAAVHERYGVTTPIKLRRR